MMKKIILMIILTSMLLMLVGCGCNHTFEDATCTKPSKCSKCGETQGKALGHDFKSATCEKPSLCRVCGEEDGNPSGHSTDFGTCSKCNRFQGEDIAKEIIDTINNANAKINLGYRNSDKILTASTYDEMYSIVCNSNDFYDSARRYYNSAISLCGSYSELAKLKSYLQEAVKSCPSNPSSANRTELETSVAQAAILYVAAANVEDEAGKIGAKVGKNVTSLFE